MPKKTPTSSPQSKPRQDGGLIGEATPATNKISAAKLDLSKPGASGLPATPPVPAKGPHGSRLEQIFSVAQAYGERSFDNYANIRSLAETLRDEFCAWLSETTQCVYLVPPEGRFSAKDYQSAAFSVAGQGYLPLKPISFGLAVRVSEDKDFMRLKLTCRKEGSAMFVRIEKGAEIRLDHPIEDGALSPLFRALYEHISDFFQHSIDDYDNGHYGTQEIGFDLQRMSG